MLIRAAKVPHKPTIPCRPLGVGELGAPGRIQESWILRFFLPTYFVLRFDLLLMVFKTSSHRS